MSVASSLESIKHWLSLNEFSENGLVSVEPISGTKCDCELRACWIWSSVWCSQLSPLNVSHSQVFIVKSCTECTNIFFTHFASWDTWSWETLMEACSCIASSFWAFAKLFETFRGGWLFIGVELKNKITNFLFTLCYGEIDTGIGRIWVVVKTRESASAECKKLSWVHFINY